MKTKRTVERSYRRAGKTEQEVPFKGNVIDGVIRDYHKNGVLASEIPMKNGVLHGECKQWSENGKLLGTSILDEGTGYSRSWFPNGQIQAEIHLIKSVPNGPERLWLADGTLIHETFCLAGKIVSRKIYEAARQHDSRLPEIAAQSQSPTEKPAGSSRKKKKS